MTRLQGQRKRWPDILIALLALALLGGFAYLLLAPKAPEPTVQTQTTVQTPIPTAPGTVTATPPATPETSVQEGTEAAPVATPEESPSEAAQAPASEESNTSAQPVPEPEPQAPVSSTVAEAPAAVIEAPQPAPVEAPEPPSPQTPPPADVAALPTQPASGSAVAASAARAPTRSEYRISLGGFGSSARALSSTQAVASLGYTVYPIDLGDQVVAQVGPFATAAEAQRALADIQRVYSRAALFAPRPGATQNSDSADTSDTGAAQPSSTQPTSTRPAPPRAAPAAAATPSRAAQPATRTPAPAPAAAQAPAQARQPARASAPPAAAAPTSPAPSPAPSEASQPAPKAAPSGPVYLQVGAFEQPEGAQKLVAQLRDEGFSPTVDAPEGERVTVLIGPFSGEAVTAAESQLDASGYDHFRIR
ncbi:SPOR domain-containing protein [Deinococcus lacus]|uniref:SPOR domain-containing protein n=1 Tax=Deinococcus lacus TaxID=392561 RepID=A0ABW1YD46_9DEIO